MSALYDELGVGYARARRPDPRIAAEISEALGGARSVINVGAGTGSYEPVDRDVLAVEPSDVMIGQRPRGAAPCLRASAAALPIRTAAFDAGMAVLTIHHWGDWRRGITELRRVARQRIVLLTFDPDASGFWLTEDYFPGIMALDRTILPSLDEIASLIGTLEVTPLFVPHDCTDGFLGAFWRRPQAYLDPVVRRSISSFSRIGDTTGGLGRLAHDLESGRWRERYAHLSRLDALDLGYRLVRCELAK